MKKSDRIRKLAEIEALKGAELGSRLQAAQRLYLEECRKLKQLQTYREEYADRFDASGKQGMTALQLADFSRFVQKLDEASSSFWTNLEKSASCNAVMPCLPDASNRSAYSSR